MCSIVGLQGNVKAEDIVKMLKSSKNRGPDSSGIYLDKIHENIDLNAFFANAEIAVNPSLKGKPVVISGESRRGIVSTASYEARQYGIHSAMPLFKAKELCPELISIPPNFELYKTSSITQTL